MILGAMQSHFMPGIGFFGLMKYVDKFVILDDVQFDKRSWQQRNFFSIAKRKKYLTVPVLTKGKFSQVIKNVKINYNEKFIIEHLKTIETNYNKKAHFSEIFPQIKKIYEKEHIYLNDLNNDLIFFIKNYLDIDTEIIFSSNLKVETKKEKKIDEICNLLGCKHYISTIGSKNYLENLKNTNYQIKYYKIKNLNYKDKIDDGLCLLDVLFNIGKATSNYLEECFDI